MSPKRRGDSPPESAPDRTAGPPRPFASEHQATPALPLGWPGVALVCVALLYLATYVVLAALRLRFPFELEWMEGASIGHIDRLVRGQPLYVKPSIDFTPFIYPPLYFQVSAWLAKLVGVGFLPLRLVSIAASFGCFALLYALVRPESRSPAPALVAAGLFAACYRQGGAWLDIGRVDSMFLCLVLGAYVVLRRVGSPWIGGAVAGLLFALAALTKQAALFIAAPVALAVLATDWRRGAALSAALGIVFGATYAVIQQQSQGWFHFYLFELPRHHPVIGQLLRGFWIEDLLGPVGIALAIGACHFFAAPLRPRLARVTLDAVMIGALVITGYLTRIRVGSYVNVLLPAYLAAAALFGLGLAALFEKRDRATPGGRMAECYVLLVCLVQFAVLAYKPWLQIPSDADRVAGEQIVESLKRVEGDVWVPRHPYLAAMAGKPWRSHELAMQDVLRRDEMPAQHELVGELNAAARAHRFAVLVLDDETWVHGTFAPYYSLKAKMFRDDEARLFFPVTGYYTRPGTVWLPSDSLGSTQR